MKYESVQNAIDQAWDLFFDSLKASGLTEEQILKVSDLMDSKDCFHDVMDCAMGALR